MTPKLYQYYPEEYTHIFLRAFDKPIRIPSDTLREARLLRQHFYAFRTAIRDSKPEEAVLNELKLKAQMLSFTIDGTTILIHRPKRSSNLQKALVVAQEQQV